MTRNQWYTVVILAIVILAGLFALIFVPSQTSEPSQNLPSGSAAASSTASLADLITVNIPLQNSAVSSPLTISGQARGNWYFEASAPVELRNASGTVIAQGHINAQGDWMTTEYVPFTATLTFAKQAAGSKGTLVLKNDNPSGDPARQKELSIPVTF